MLFRSWHLLESEGLRSEAWSDQELVQKALLASKRDPVLRGLWAHESDPVEFGRAALAHYRPEEAEQLREVAWTRAQLHAADRAPGRYKLQVKQLVADSNSVITAPAVYSLEEQRAIEFPILVHHLFAEWGQQQKQQKQQ